MEIGGSTCPRSLAKCQESSVFFGPARDAQTDRALYLWYLRGLKIPSIIHVLIGGVSRLPQASRASVSNKLNCPTRSEPRASL